MDQKIERSLALLNVDLQQVALGTDEDFFSNFVIGIVNRFIVLLDNYWKLQPRSNGLILSEGNQPRLDLSNIPLQIRQGNVITSIVEYFK